MNTSKLNGYKRILKIKNYFEAIKEFYRYKKNFIDTLDILINFH